MLQFMRAFEAAGLQHRDALILGVAAILVILALLWATASRKRYIVLRRSSETEMLVLQLGGIADALDRIAAREEIPPFTSDQILREAAVETVESAPPLEPAPAPAFRANQAGVGSMFGFNRREALPNPLFRPK